MKSAASLLQLNVVEPDLPPNDLFVRFANTSCPRVSRSKFDRAEVGVIPQPFEGFADLVDWLAAMDGLGEEVAAVRRLAGADPEAAREEFAAVLELRPLFLRVAGALARNRLPAEKDYAVLAGEAAAFPVSLEFVADASGGGWTIPRADEATLRRPRRQLVFSALHLLSTELRFRVRLCPGKDCGLFFVAQPGETKRVWCHRGICGVRQAYRRRTRR